MSFTLEEGPHYVRAHLGEKDYWPWDDKAVSFRSIESRGYESLTSANQRCTMSALRGFPRALFSESELEGVRWFAHANGVPTLPSVKMIEREQEDITRVAGAAPEMYTSKMGRVYAMATLAVMLAHVSSMDICRHLD